MMSTRIGLALALAAIASPVVGQIVPNIPAQKPDIRKRISKTDQRALTAAAEKRARKNTKRMAKKQRSG